MTMTNYEKVMSEMTIEKLANLIDMFMLDKSCDFCAYYMNLNRVCGVCRDGIEEWLKQDAKDGE